MFLHKVFFIDLFVHPVNRRLTEWRGDRVVDGARLESECACQRAPRVRIPSSPQV